MNRTLALAAMASLLSTGVVFAQDASTNSSPNPPAVATGQAPAKTAAAPVAGKNSFTMKQAAHRLHKHGYKTIKDLALDDQGVWRGTATKDGKPVGVAVDYQGNITEQ